MIGMKKIGIEKLLLKYIERGKGNGTAGTTVRKAAALMACGNSTELALSHVHVIFMDGVSVPGCHHKVPTAAAPAAQMYGLTGCW